MTALKILATIALSCVVLATAYLCLILSICTFGGIGETGNRVAYGLLDLLDIAIMIGALVLIVKMLKTR